MIRYCDVPRPAAASSTRRSTAPRWSTSTAACSRRTRATRPAGRTRRGHKQMWFAARDIAFENPVDRGRDRSDARSAWASAPAAGADARSDARGRRGDAPFHDLDLALEMMVAPHDRAAAHRDLGVPHVRVGRGGARPTPTSSPATARRPSSCRYIRADETPHVEYLQDRAHRDARPHVRRRLGQEARRHRGDRHALGRGRSSSRSARDREHAHQADRAARSSTRSRRSPTARRHPRAVPRARTRRRRSGREARVDEVRHLLRAPAAASVGRRTASTS